MFYYCYRVVSSFHKVNKTFEKHLNEEFSSTIRHKVPSKVGAVNLVIDLQRFVWVNIYHHMNNMLLSYVIKFMSHLSALNYSNVKTWNKSSHFFVPSFKHSPFKIQGKS